MNRFLNTLKNLFLQHLSNNNITILRKRSLLLENTCVSEQNKKYVYDSRHHNNCVIIMIAFSPIK